MERERTPDWLVERLALGELPEAEAARVLARLEADGELGRLDAIAASNRELLERHPAARVAASIRQKADGEKRRDAWRPLALALPAALAAAAVVVMLPERPAPTEGPEAVRLKGIEPQLRLFRRGAAGPERLAPGHESRARDLLQLGYVAAGRRYGVIVSIDGRGTVTRHLPERGGDAAALAQDGAVALPQAYELDDAPAFERFFLVTADAPFAAAAVEAAARALARDPAAARARELPLAAGFEQTSFLVVKVP